MKPIWTRFTRILRSTTDPGYERMGLNPNSTPPTGGKQRIGLQLKNLHLPPPFVTRKMLSRPSASKGRDENHLQLLDDPCPCPFLLLRFSHPSYPKPAMIRNTLTFTTMDHFETYTTTFPIRSRRHRSSTIPGATLHVRIYRVHYPSFGPIFELEKCLGSSCSVDMSQGSAIIL